MFYNKQSEITFNIAAIIDSLNQIMDTSKILSETESQDELSIFANVQFTYDNKKESAKDIHSLIHHKLASLVDHNNPTMMSPGKYFVFGFFFF